MVTIKLTRKEICTLQLAFSQAHEFTGDENRQPDQDHIDKINEKLLAAKMRANHSI